MKNGIFNAGLIICSFLIFGKGHLCTHEQQEIVELREVTHVKAFNFGEAQYIEPNTVVTGYLSVRPMEIKGFNAEALVKLHKAFEVVEKVVNSQEFKERVLNFKNKRNQRAFASNRRLSNEKIFSFFMEGRERLQRNTPGEMNFYLSLYNEPGENVIGWTNPETNIIYINWKYFKDFNASEVAGNLVHEWAHKIGFDHKSAFQYDSVPYGIGYIVRELGQKYLKGEELH